MLIIVEGVEVTWAAPISSTRRTVFLLLLWEAVS
jgi:hypothetical protein